MYDSNNMITLICRYLGYAYNVYKTDKNGKREYMNHY